MQRLRFLIPLGFALALALTSCGGGVSTNASQSFIAGNGAVTFISLDKRAPAPQLQGKTIEETTFNQQVNKVTVVNVWASWCAPCRAEALTLAALSRKYPETQFVGVLTRDNPAAAGSFVKRFGMPYPTLIDDAVLLGFHSSLVANAIPSTFVLDKNGKVAARISGEVTVASLSALIERVVAE